MLVVLQRAEMATRMGEEIERNVIELGREGRLIDMQLDRADGGRAARPHEPGARLRSPSDGDSAETALARLADLPYRRLLDFEELPRCSGTAA